MSRITVALSKFIGVTKDSREKSVLSSCKGTQGIALKPIVSFKPCAHLGNIAGRPGYTTRLLLRPNLHFH